MNNFERVLYSKTTQQQNNFPIKSDSDLFSFWSFLKEQLTERLSIVSSVFPHYSLHDSTHSEKILDIIWKLYGEKALNTLSVSNIFIILAVAYSHDLGMTVLSDDFSCELNSDEFIKLVKTIKENSNHACYKYAECFELKDNKLYYKCDLPLNTESYNAARYLLSVYFRNKHAERSEKDVHNIFSRYKIYLKNSVITQIGKICLAHNQDFEEVLKIPKEENGIYGDTWNPLFVACSLRLGDLLDLESDRFSESYWNSLPSKPQDAEWHRKKHESIKHFLVNQEVIEATAECEQYEIYKLVADEFQMIKTEVANQMSHWTKIAPAKDFSSLPCIGDFSVRLNDYNTLKEGEIPTFRFNTEKAFELIKGAGLYTDKCFAIREILQNAVDATILRCFLENEADKDSLNFENFNNLLAKRKIFFSLKRKTSETEKAETVIWEITVSDKGIGMDKEDIRYLLEVASSSKNPFRKEIIERMPEWSRPSGTFGLGFQSVFQLADQITVTTRKVNSAYEYTMFLESPSKNTNYNVRLQEKKADFSAEFGTTIVFDFEVPAIPQSFSFSIGESFSNNVIADFDFVTDKSLDYEISRIINAVYGFAAASSIPVDIKFENKDSEVVKFDTNNGLYKKHFFPEYNIELIVPEKGNSFRYFYRNAVISKTSSRIRFIPFSANILSSNAKEVLTYNREDFRDTKSVNNILDNTVYAGRKYLIENYSKLSEEMKFQASMYVRYYDNKSDNIESQSAEIFSKWQSFSSLLKKEDEKNITFKEIVDYTGLVKLEIRHSRNFGYRFCTEKTNECVVITTEFYIPDEIHFLIKEMLRAGKRLQLAKYENGELIYEFTSFTNEEERFDFVKDYEALFSNVLSSYNFFKRFTIPCNSKYKKLAVDCEKSFIPADCVLGVIRHDFPYKFEIPLMVSPYVRNRKSNAAWELKLKNLENVTEFVYENRADKKVTKKEIEDLYDDFINETKKAVEKVNV